MPNIYGLDTTAQELADAARELARDVALPVAEEVDRQGRFPREALAALGGQKYWGLCLPAEVGGLAQPPRTFAAVVEEIAQACSSTAMVYVMHVAAAQAIAASTVLGRRDALLREIAAGMHLTTLAFSERGSRSQFWAPVSTLRQDGDAYLTSAAKSWITSANEADSYVASAQKPGAASPLESTLYLAPRLNEAVTVSGAFDGLGLRGNDSAPVTIDDLTLSQQELITENGDGARMMLQVVLPWFAVGSAAMANGICRAAVAATAGHLSGTGFEHDANKLRDLPNLRARLAEMSVRTEQSRALLAVATASMQEPDEQTPLYVLQTRLAALEAALAVTDLAMKACGGAAFSRHLGVERLFRDARAGWVMAPTADHLRDFVGRALTGMPLF